MKIGPYTIERELGRGGMGAVYLGRESADSPAVAVKVIHTDLALDPELAARFEREGAALARLDHPNIVSLVARGTQRGGLWLAMEFVKGASLAERLKTGGPWPSHAAGELLVALCEGIAHAHEAGLLHRDLKPENVLLRALDGQPLIVDFGLTLPLDVSQHLTQTGEIMGSPGYLAPEQCGLGEPASPATDVYGLGALLYSVLTGQPPLRGASILATLDQVLNVTPRPLSDLVPNVDPVLEAICLRCLAKNPAERYRDARELQQALLGEPALAPTKGRRFQRTLLLVTGGLLLAVLAATLTWQARPENPGAVSSSSPSPTSSAPQASTPTASAPPASPSSSPARVAPPQLTPFEEALGVRDWASARTQLAGVTGVEGAWQRYRLLKAELSLTGEETPDWRATREEALRLASEAGPDATPQAQRWLRGFGLVLYMLRDPYLGALQVEDPKKALRALQAALVPTLDQAQRCALREAIAQLRRGLVGTKAEPELTDPELAKEAIEQWASEGGEPWEIHLCLSKIALRSGDQSLLFWSLHGGELAAREANHPWARFAFYWIRTPRRRAGRRHARNTALSAKALLASQSPPSLKSAAAGSLAEFLIQERDARQAVKVLREHPAPEGASRRVREAHQRVLAVAELRAGNADAVLALLGSRGAPASKGYFRDQLLRSSAHAIRGERQLASAALAAATPGPQGTPAPLLVDELQAAILNRDQERAERASERLSRARDLPALLSALDALRWTLALGDPQGAPLISDVDYLRNVGPTLTAALAPQFEQHVLAMIQRGDWEKAIDLSLRLRRREDPEQHQGVLRTCYRALKRGLNEETPTSPRWQKTLSRVRRFLAGSPLAKPKSSLDELFESLDDVSPERRAKLLVILEGESRREPLWEEFSEAVARLWQSSHQTGFARRRFLALKRRAATKAWERAFPKSAQARYQVEFQSRAPGWEARLQALLGELPKTDPLRREIGSLWALAGYKSGALGRREFTDLLETVISDPATLRQTRRELLLTSAETLPASPESATETLVLLDRIVALTGPLTQTTGVLDSELRVRYYSLRASAELALGRADPALLAARQVEGDLARVQPPLRARAEVVFGAAEIEAGVAGARKRLRRSLESFPTRSGCLTLARHSQGEDQREAYALALGYPADEADFAELLKEIEGAGLDPTAVAQSAMIYLEAKGTSALPPARILFEDREDEARAMLLWEALRIDELTSPRQAKQFRDETQSLLARARDLLPAPARPLVAAQEELFKSLRDLDQKRVGASARVSEALRELRAAAADSPPLVSDRLRTPLLIMNTLKRLSPSGQAPAGSTTEELEAWIARGTAPLRLPLWLATRDRRAGRLQPAARRLKEALERIPLTLPALRATLLLHSAAVASFLGEERRALGFLAETLRLSRSAKEVIRASLSEAQIRLRLGENERALEAAEVASELCPKENHKLWAQTRLLVGRVLLEAEGPKTARDSLTLVKSSPHFAKAGTGAGADAKTLEAAIFSAEENWVEALKSSEAAIGLDPGETGAHRARLEALSRLGRSDEARAAAKDLSTDARIPPRARAEFAAWLEKNAAKGE